MVVLRGRGGKEGGKEGRKEGERISVGLKQASS